MSETVVYVGLSIGNENANKNYGFTAKNELEGGNSVGDHSLHGDT